MQEPVDELRAAEGLPRVRRAGATIARRASWLLRPLMWLSRTPAAIQIGSSKDIPLIIANQTALFSAGPNSLAC